MPVRKRFGMGMIMEELYRAIEEKIKASGYPDPVDGFEIYSDLSDQIEGKENGEYVLMSKREEDCWYEYRVQIMEDEFNLSVLIIHTQKQDYHIDFDL